MKWFTADLHLGHKNIIKYCERPFKNSHQMDKEIIHRINEKVAPEDELYIIGDFTLYGSSASEKVKQYLNKINGHKILILGNHDQLKPFTYIDVGFESVHTSLEVEDYVLVHDPAIANVDLSKKWLVGHVHNLFKKIGNVLNVGVDVWDFYPVSLNEINNMFNYKDE